MMSKEEAMDNLMGKQTTVNGVIYTVIEVDRTCYHPSHSPSNPWIMLSDNKGNKRVGCLNTIAPQLREI